MNSLYTIKIIKMNQMHIELNSDTQKNSKLWEMRESQELHLNFIKNNSMKGFLRFLSLMLIFLTYGFSVNAQTCDTICASQTNKRFISSPLVGVISYDWTVTALDGGPSLSPVPNNNDTTFVNMTGGFGSYQICAAGVDLCGIGAYGCDTFYVANITLNGGSVSTTCAANNLSYTLSFVVNGSGPFVATGVGAPGLWTGNTWTSNSIAIGTAYNINVSDASACSSLNVSGSPSNCNLSCDTICASETNKRFISSTVVGALSYDWTITALDGGPSLSPVPNNNDTIFVNMTGGFGSYQICAAGVDLCGIGAYGCDTFYVAPSISLNGVNGGSVLTTCAANSLSYTLSFAVNGTAPFVASGVGAPGIWIGNAWTSNSIATGTAYNTNISDATACSSLNVSGASPICDPCIATSINLNITKTDATASGGCTNGTATAAVTGGTAPYSYAWSNGLGTNATASNMIGPGTYTLVVTDANGCTLTQSLTVDCVNNCDAVVAINSLTAVLCNGGNTGSATVSATSVANPGAAFTFVWRQGTTTVFTTNSATSSTYTGASAGVYIVSVTIDGTACQPVQQSVTITQPLTGVSATATTLLNQITVGGTEGTVTAAGSGGTAPYSYVWSSNAGNATTPTVSGLLPGNYCVTVTDSNSCAAGSVCTLVSPFTCATTPTIGFNATNITCNGLSNGSVVTTVSGGVTPYSFLWTGTGVIASAQNQSGLAAGTYLLTVTDAVGCQSQSSITITQPNLLSAGVAVSNVQCNGATTGALNLTVNGGTAPYSFAWSNGPITEDQNSVPAGNYNVVVTDAKGCSVSLSANITQPGNALSLNITKTDATATGGCTNGTATAVVTGGTAPYSYVWSNSLGMNATATNMTGPGTYTLVVTDLNGCTLVQSITIDCMNNCDAAVAITSTTGVLCNGGNTGSATVSATSIEVPGGPFTFVWRQGATTVFTTNSATSSTYTGASAGVYIVSVTIDGTACQPVQQIVTITQPMTGLSATATTLLHQSTVGGTQGTVTAAGSGGTSPYSYVWSSNAGNATTPTVSGLLPGNYCVTVTDSNACVVSSVCTIVLPFTCTTSPTIVFNSTNVTCNGAINGSVVATVSGGVTPYSFLWTGTGVIASAQNQSGLAAGTYLLTVTDAVGCQSPQSSITITQPTPLVGSIVVTNITCNGGNNGAMNASVSGGSGPYTYLWSNGSTFPNITNLTAGNDSVVITDVNGCSITRFATVTQPVLETIGAIVDVLNPGCGQSNGSITLETVAVNTNWTITYSRNGFGQTASVSSNALGQIVLSNLSAGNYSNFQLQNVISSCLSNTFPGPVALTQLAPPVYTNANVSQTNATSCSICDGSLTISGLPISTSMTISYYRNLVLVSPGYTATTSPAGVFVIPNLCIGQYTDLVVTNNATTCVSGPIPGPFTIAPNTSLGSIDGETDTICVGSSTLISTLINEPGVSVYWRINSATGPLLNGGAPSPTITVSPLVTTWYTAELLSNTGCRELDTITVYVNSAPVAMDDGCFPVTEDVPSIGSLIANFTANDNITGLLNGQVVYNVVSVQYGSMTINNGTDSYVYTPGLNFSGYDTATVRSCNAACTNLCSTFKVCFLVQPVIDTLNLTTDEDVPVTVCPPAISNMGAGAIFSSCGGPNYGTLTTDNLACATYIPALNYVGPDNACLVLCNNGICDTTYFNITVTPVTDTLPLSTPEDVPVTVCVPMISDMGPGATFATCSGSALTSNGTVSFATAGCLTYTPNANYVGNDEICLVVCNNGICDTTFIPVTVTPVTDTLVVTTPEDTPITVCVPMITDMGIGATYETCDGTMFTANGIVTIDPLTRCFTYTPYTNFNGNDTACIIVCNNGFCDTTTIVIIVTPVNDSPLAINDINVTLENSSVTGSVAVNDSDPDSGDILTFSVLTSAPTSQGDLTLLPDGTYTFVPVAGYLGTMTYTYYVCDNGVPSLCDTANLVINVLPSDPYVANNPPLANNDNASVTSLSPITICVICNDFDPDGDPITLTSILPNGFTIVDNGNGTVTVTPPASTMDTVIVFQYVICDNTNPALCDTATVTINVSSGSNNGIQPPFAIDDAMMSNGGLVSGNVLTNDLNPDGGPLTVSQLTNPTSGSVVFDPITGAYTYMPNPGYQGPDHFVYEICDVFGNCSQATVYIIVLNDNNPPIAINDVNHTFNGIPVSGSVGTNDIERDNDPVTFTLVADVNSNSGTLVFNADGTYTYTSAPGFSGTAVFTYSICDDGGLCDTAQVVIDVDLYNPPTNNPPIAINDNLVTYGHPLNPATISICVICNDSDPDGDAISVALVPSSGPANGTLVDNGNGTFTYTPNLGFIGEDQFTYVLCDTEGLCDTALVTVAVLYNADPTGNHAPFATDDYFVTQVNTTIINESVLPNDFDLDGDGLTVSLVSTTSNGTLVLNADGTFSYIPNSGFAGEDQFTYQLCDDGNPVLCDFATVYFTVFPAPVIAINDSQFVTNVDPISVNVLANDTFTGASSVTILTEPLNGTVVVNADGTVTYYPGFPAVGVDSFQYMLCVNTICDEAWVVLAFQLGLFIPDGISPNGDGLNDVFVIENLLSFYPAATLVLYNRWGDEIWNSFGPYQNNWFGTNLQDELLPDGTYFYVLDYRDGNLEPRQGFLAIYR